MSTEGDLKEGKSTQALNIAMLSLLESRNFKNITVGDICSKALVARTTFYAYFADKYDFLKWWIPKIWFANIGINDTYEAAEEKVNSFVEKNKNFIRNLFIDADNYTLDAIFEVFHFILCFPIQDRNKGKRQSNYIVQSNFYIYGMIHYIIWQVKNNFPQNIRMMNPQLYEIIKMFQEQNDKDEGVFHE